MNLSPQRQPVYIRAFNWLGATLAGAGLKGPGLQAGRLRALARFYTRLNDFGDPSYEEGLERLVQALEHEAQLSTLGRFVAYGNLVNLLSIRLRLVQARAGVTDSEVERPLIITGLPRTGTTILHELIACDPGFRAPLTWQVTRPVPTPIPAGDSDSRISTVARFLAIMEKLSPGFQTIHALGASLPQECVYLFSSQFYSEQFAYMFKVPAYRRWLLDQDMTSTYAWHKAFLAHLQKGWPATRWVLKTPAHLASLDALLACYPDAQVVWTHRRPREALASFASLTSTLRGGFSDKIDKVAVGQHEQEHFSAVLTRASLQRDRLPQEQFLDVGFDAICTDPIGVVESIYRHFNIPFSESIRARMEAYLEIRPRDLYGVHRYTAQEFGLDESAEMQYFGDYLARYQRWC